MPLSAPRVPAPLSLCCLDTRRCQPRPSMPASLTPGRRQLAGGEACDPKSPVEPWRPRSSTARWRSLGARLPPSSSRGPHSGIPAPQRRAREPEDPCSIPGARSGRPAPLVPLPGAARRFPASAHGPARALRRHRRSSGPRAAPAHPGRHPALIRAPSLARCPLLALESLTRPGGYCRRQGSLPHFGPLGDRELRDRRDRCSPRLALPPAEAPVLQRPWGHSSKEPRACREVQ